MKFLMCALALSPLALAGCATAPDAAVPTKLSEADTTPKKPFADRVSYYARVYDVPEALIHRSIARESSYNPAQHHGAFWGLMQVRLDTARSMGYRGTAKGLLDPDTNLKYAVAYLSNAYVVADGDSDRAIALYSRGYFYEARRKGLLDRLRKAEAEADADAPASND